MGQSGRLAGAGGAGDAGGRGALAAIGDEVIRIGSGSAIRYALRDTSRGFASAPIYRVSDQGQIEALGTLVPVRPDGFVMVQADGAAFLEQAEKGIDLLLVDAFDRTGYAPELACQEFFESAFEKLSGSGVLVVNLAGEPATYAGLVGRVMAAFDDRVLVVGVPEDGNHVLYAFKSRDFDPRWRALAQQARELKARFGLDFPRFVEKLERAAKQGIARRLWQGDYL